MNPERASCPHDPKGPSIMKTASRIGLWLVAGGALALVALAYLNPHLMVDLASRLWACF